MEGRGLADVADIFKRLIPENVFKAAAEGEMLGLIFFSLLLGYFITRIAADKQATLTAAFQAFYELMLAITEFIN